MASIISKIFGAILPKSVEQTHAEAYREAIREEAKVGGKVFGPVPAGGRREFFCLDEHTWVWHEEWLEHGETRSITTRYDVTPNGIFKAQDDQPYRKLEREEAERLVQAVKQYNKLIDAELAPLLTGNR